MNGLLTSKICYNYNLLGDLSQFHQCHSVSTQGLSEIEADKNISIFIQSRDCEYLNIFGIRLGRCYVDNGTQCHGQGCTRYQAVSAAPEYLLSDDAAVL